MVMSSGYPGGNRGGGGGNYANGSHSPPYSQSITSYDPSNGTSPATGSFSPTHTVSPTGNGTSVNGYSQVPSYTDCTVQTAAVLSDCMDVCVHVHALGVLCCFALFVCLILLASFFLPSHLSFKNMCMPCLFDLACFFLPSHLSLKHVRACVCLECGECRG